MILAHSEINLEERDEHGVTAFLRSMQGNSLAMPRLLLDHGAMVDSTDSQGATALFSSNSDAKGCFLLLNGADPNHRSNDGSTPLMFAARWGDVEGIDLLVSAGADINGRDKEGRSALVHALRTTATPPGKSLPAAIRLLELGASCDKVEVFGEPLHDFAQRRGSKRLLTAMAAAGCAASAP